MSIHVSDDSASAAKKLFRHQYAALRDRLSPEERTCRSRTIIQRLTTLPLIADAASIFIYVSFRSEVETHDFINLLLASGKTVAVPLINRQRRIMLPVRISSWQSLAPGPLGIMEPQEKTNDVLTDIDAVIVPGLAFSLSGMRLGYGAGFYDSFLRTFPAPSVGLAFEFQLCNDLPFIPGRDMPVDHIVTECRCINCSAVAHQSG